MIGGTGFLGFFATRQLVAAGHRVTAVGLEVLQPGMMPAGVDSIALDTDAASSEEMVALLADADVLVHASGADGRFTAKPPAIKAFRRKNVDPFLRLIPAMQQAGTGRLVILGSYYTALARAFPELPIMTRSAYPISRAEQAELAFALAGTGIDVAILELPFIFGAAPGRGTLWGHVIDRIVSADGPVVVPAGGTACVTAAQVGQAVAAAAERAKGHDFYPIGSVNWSHRQIYAHFARALGVEREWVAITPEDAHAQAVARLEQLAEAGLETGYHPLDLAVLEAADLFIEPGPAMSRLGYGDDDIGAAIAATVRATQAIGGAGPGSIILEN
jgi:nucleoside-diphosphate-sugar epimerase